MTIPKREKNLVDRKMFKSNNRRLKLEILWRLTQTVWQFNVNASETVKLIAWRNASLK